MLVYLCSLRGSGCGGGEWGREEEIREREGGREGVGVGKEAGGKDILSHHLYFESLFLFICTHFFSLSVCLSIPVFVYFSASQPVQMFTNLSIVLFICLSTSVYNNLSIYLSIYVSIYLILSVFVYISTSLCLSSIFLSIYLSSTFLFIF